MAAVGEHPAIRALIFRTSSLKLPLDDQLADLIVQLFKVALAPGCAVADAALERPRRLIRSGFFQTELWFGCN
ncbi:hypothetical protein [Bradyrhizobium japonicum]|uniref:hypothetical protein n=1 Tax=Bradyrhizobium japonicum TaxID=375 RepID=UPI000AB65CA3|nr:hypothetical protein [Bradyrhizobium japonicum]